MYSALSADVRASLTRLRSLWALAAIVLVAVGAALTIGLASPAAAASGAAAQDASDLPSDAVISPDGKRAAWTSEDAKSVWSARRTAAGQPPRWGSPERLLTIRGTVGDIVFSPDSRRIAFENPRDTHGFIAVYDIPAGRSPCPPPPGQQVCEDRIRYVDPVFAADSDPEWSRDGRQIAFVRRDGTPDARVTVDEPSAAAGTYEAQGAIFGPWLDDTGVDGDVVLVDDGSANPTLGCNPLVDFPSGAIALVDRGTCTFVEKVRNAQDAGATAVILVNNVAGAPVPMTGIAPDVTIPSVMVGQSDGTAIRAGLPAAGGLESTAPTLTRPAPQPGWTPPPARPGDAYRFQDLLATPISEYLRFAI